MKRLNLLDSAVVILSSCTLTLFLFWAAGETLHLEIFQSLPEYLQGAAKNVLVLISTGGSGALVVYLIRRQISTDDERPNYVVYIGILTVMLCGSILLLGQLLPSRAPAPPDPSQITISSSAAEDIDGGYLSYDITGDFFSKGSLEPLGIEVRSVDSDGRPVKTKLGDPGFNTLVLNRGTQRIVQMTSGYESSVAGFCRASDSGKLNVIVSEWGGAAAIPAVLSAVSYDNNLNKAVSHPLDVREAGDVISGMACKDGESWKTAEKLGRQVMIPCHCSVNLSTSMSANFGKFFEKYDRLSDGKPVDEAEMPDAFFRGEKVPFPGTGVVVRNDDVQDILLDSMKLGGTSPIRVQQLRSSNYEVLALSTDNDTHIYEPSRHASRSSGEQPKTEDEEIPDRDRPSNALFDAGIEDGLVMARRVGEDDWTVLLRASDSSHGGFDQPALVRVADPDSFIVRICVEDCSWTIYDAFVRIDLNHMTAEASDKSKVLSDKKSRDPGFSGRTPMGDQSPLASQAVLDQGTDKEPDKASPSKISDIKVVPFGTGDTSRQSR